MITNQKKVNLYEIIYLLTLNNKIMKKVIEKYKPEEIRELVIDYVIKENLTISKFCNLCWISRVTFYRMLNKNPKYIKKRFSEWLKRCWILQTDNTSLS